jgi:hypothetical protein
MSMRAAAVLACIAMILLTALLAVDWVNDVVAYARGLLAVATLFRLTIYLFSSVCLLIFFVVFLKRQS